ncbi:MAG: DUF2752 domain-containing protein [Bacteroidales bacterium]|nr:DUF2752 domain-containing protein [Bacteroidales bacterium]
MMNRIRPKAILDFLYKNFEGFFWLTALVLLALMSPALDAPSLCAFRWLGIESCPGCGLGHSISAAFHGQFAASFDYHPLGIFALLVLSFRSFSVFKSYFLYQKQKTPYYDQNL